MRLTPGTRVGPYEVVSLLGAGGMAEVYRAKDTRLGREVAIKVVSEALGGDGAFLERFDREAKLAASLAHPNVVALHDVGFHDGKPYFVTELLQGESLRERLAKGPIPLAKALEWAAQMAQGLAAAHERGIVHRDLKPENVFITRDGHVKLLDFGIAKLIETAQAATPHGLMDPTVSPSGGSTGTGMVLGTPGYMSPEQVRGDPIDARTDSFSLGAVLYEMLCGRRAFPAGPVVESGYAILHNDPEPLPGTVPPQVAQVVHRCLEKEPARRFQSARDLAFNLELVRTPTGSTGPTRLPPRRRGKRWWWSLLVPAAVAIGIVAFRTTALRKPILPTVRQLTFRRGAVVSSRFAADGMTVLFTATWSGEAPSVYSMTIGSPEYHPVIEGAKLEAVASGGELALLLHPALGGESNSVGTLARAPGVGSSPREVLEDVSSADWSPDGVDLAVVRKLPGKTVLEFPVGHVVYESPINLGFARVSPGGDRIAVFEYTVAGDATGDLVVVTRNGEKQVLAAGWAEFTGVAWAPSGDEVWFSALRDGPGNEVLWAVAPGGQPRILYQGTGRLSLDDVSRDGRLLVREVDDRRDIAIVNLVDNSKSEHLGWLDYSRLAALSADGKSVLFTETGWGVPQLYLVYWRKRDGSAAIRLGEGWARTLSPDDRWALITRTDQPQRLWQLPVAAGSSRSVEIPGLEQVTDAAYFPDGTRAVLRARRKGEAFRGYLVDLGQTQVRAVTPPLECCFAISPDARFVAGLPTEGVVTAYPLEDGAITPFPELGREYVPVAWLKSGLFVAHFSSRQGAPPVSIFAFDTKTHTRQLVTTLAPKDVAGITTIDNVVVATDEKSVAYDYIDYTSRLFVIDLAPKTR